MATEGKTSVQVHDIDNVGDMREEIHRLREHIKADGAGEGIPGLIRPAPSVEENLESLVPAVPEACAMELNRTHRHDEFSRWRPHRF